MLNREEFMKAKWTELIKILDKIIQDKINLTEGCREVNKIYFQLNEPEKELFKVFIGYDSESDSFPLGNVRQHWDAASLEKMDKEREKIENHYRKWILDAAHALLKYAQEQSI